MRFNKSLAAAGALGLAVLTASPALAETPADIPAAPVETTSPEAPVDKPAEPTEQPSEKPADKPSEKPSEKPSQKPSEKPSDKPAAKPTESAKPKRSEAKAEEKKEVEQKGSITLSTATAKPGEVITVSVTSTREAIRSISSRAFSPGSWNVEGDRLEYRFQVRVSNEPGRHPVDARFADGSYARAELTVQEQSAVKTSITVDRSTAKPGDIVNVSVKSDGPDVKAITSRAFSPGSWNVPAGYKEYRFQVRVSNELGRHAVDAHFADGSYARTELTVKSADKPVPVTGLSLDLSPSRIVAGQSYYAGITTQNVEPGTPVTLTDPAGRKHVVRVNGWGEAHVRLSSPKGTDPGRYTVRASLPSGQSHSATLTVVKRHPQTQLELILDPNRVYAGGKFTAIVATSSFGKTNWATITDPSGKRFSVKIGKSGVGAKKFHVPSSTRAGTYWFKATLSNGKTDWAKLTVKPKYRASNYSLTPKGGAATGGGLPEGNAGFGGVALGGMLIAGGAGSALFARRRAEES
ncbi:hypothetical protein [Nonomuraea typhae]|uniref:hypothetical protein n=1 Tax=Nonomuraea typhae TaxID=2603600 RepID=UPI001CA574F2|nr:hypothetical protein [Nonomuraea typhae]